jgi:hypothetical protein
MSDETVESKSEENNEIELHLMGPNGKIVNLGDARNPEAVRKLVETLIATVKKPHREDPDFIRYIAGCEAYARILESIRDSRPNLAWRILRNFHRSVNDRNNDPVAAYMLNLYFRFKGNLTQMREHMRKVAEKHLSGILPCGHTYQHYYEEVYSALRADVDSLDPAHDDD